MTYQSLDTPSLRASGAAPSGAAILRRGAAGATRLLRRFGPVAAFLTFWQVGATLGWINPTVFPPLDRILAATWTGVTGGALLDDIAISLQRSGLAFAAAVAVGIPLGLFMGQMRAVEQALDPILQFFRQTSALALYPVFILLLGLGEASKVFVIFWATLFPILLATTGGVKEVDRKLIEMASTFGASRLTIFRRVILPASVPSIFVGLRLSATTALLLLIAAEMIGANKGLGLPVGSGGDGGDNAKHPCGPSPSGEKGPAMTLTGAELRRQRRAAGLTQAALAACAGVHRESIVPMDQRLKMH